MKIKLFSIILTINLIINSAFSMEPDVFVQSTVNRASKMLSENISKEKIIELRLIAKDTVDIKGIKFIHLVLRKTCDEKNKYFNLFEQYFEKVSSRLAEYTNQKLTFGKEILNDNYTIVKSVLKATNERPEINIDWRIYTKNPENPLIEIWLSRVKLNKNTKRVCLVLNSNDGDINALFETLKKFTDQ